jgi:hypothetical protein
MTARSQRKGVTGERELAECLQRLGILGTARAAREYQTGATAPDVAGVPGLHLECKRVEKLNLTAAMEQALRDSAPAEIPVVCHRRNRGKWQVTFHLAHLPQFVTAVQRALARETPFD